MNGRAAKTLRRHFGHKTAAYRRAKHQLDTKPASFAQRPKPLKERAPRRRSAAVPTWPRTANQKHQSRPVIVMHPARQTAYDQRMSKRVNTHWPKHALDYIALQHPKE